MIERPVKKKEKKEKKVETGRANIGVTIDKDLWRKLRSLAILDEKPTGDLLDEAITDYLKKKGKI